MSARVVAHPSSRTSDVWPGCVKVNRQGAELAIEMLCELEGVGNDEGGETLAERSKLENWVREGRPFRNVVAEYLAKAQAAGPDVVEGFCAMLSDYVAECCQGTVPAAEGLRTLLSS